MGSPPLGPIWPPPSPLDLYENRYEHFFVQNERLFAGFYPTFFLQVFIANFFFPIFLVRGEGWGLGVRVLHFSHFRDEKSAFFQLEVRGLP